MNEVGLAVVAAVVLFAALVVAVLVVIRRASRSSHVSTDDRPPYPCITVWLAPGRNEEADEAFLAYLKEYRNRQIDAAESLRNSCN